MVLRTRPTKSKPMNQENPNHQLSWTVRQLAADIGSGESTVRRWIAQGVCPAVKLGGRVLIPGDWVRSLFGDAMAEWSSQQAEDAPPPVSELLR
jgi:excisionase family DNA binding protein